MGRLRRWRSGLLPMQEPQAEEGNPIAARPVTGYVVMLSGAKHPILVMHDVGFFVRLLADSE